MAEEMIKRLAGLASDYAEAMHPAKDYCNVGHDDCRDDDMAKARKNAMSVLGWLLQDYALVKKDIVLDAVRHPQRHTQPIPGTLPNQVLGIKQVLKDIFGDIR